MMSIQSAALQSAAIERRLLFGAAIGTVVSAVAASEVLGDLPTAATIEAGG